MDIYEILTNLNISYQEQTHKAVYTVEEAKNEHITLPGKGCKNLFLKDKAHNYYLVVLEEDKRANLKELEKLLNTKNLRFASAEDLYKYLKLEPGSVTPLGIINDQETKVLLILDKDLIDQPILVHPNTNTKTLCLNYTDLIKIIDYTNHKYILM